MTPAAAATSGIRRNNDNIIIPKPRENTRNYEYSSAIQKARTDSGLTQFQLAEIIDLSEGAVKAYEQGINRPPPYAIRRIAEACGAPELYAHHINSDEIMSVILPPIQAGPKEKAALQFEAARKQMDAVADEVYSIADDGSPSEQYYAVLGKLVSAGVALKLTN